METSSGSHTILSCSFTIMNSLLMMMSPLFKEETSFTIIWEQIYVYPKSVLFLKTGLFCSSKKRYCYNRDNKNAIFRIIQVTVSSCCYYYSTKGSSRIANYAWRNLRAWRLFQQLSQLFQQRPLVPSKAYNLSASFWTYVSNDALRLMKKYKSIKELDVKQIKHIIKKRILYTLG